MRVSFAVFVIVMSATAAHAQVGDPRTRDAGYIGKEIPILEIDDCPPPPQVTPEDLRKIGSEHFERGETLYVQGDYKGAVHELVAAYCISPYYTILKDIGQAYERELDYEKAIAYLERFVVAVPKDAQRANSCAPDPQDEKKNVIARINVLGALKAKILINTDPADSKVTLSNDAGIAGRGRSGQELEVAGGRYEVLIEHDGYHSVTQEIPAKIGKPYTIFAKLEPLKGRLRVRVVPADARLFLDSKQVGAGAYEGELEGKRYTLSAEAPGRISVSREIEVFPNRDTPISFELPPEPQVGRRQLLGYAGIGGAFAGGFLGAATTNGGLIAGGVGAGAAAGVLGAYFGTPKDVPLGTSSLTITSSLIGGTAVGAGALLATDDPQKVLPAIGGGLIAGAGIGYYAGSRLRIRPGDAAVINSGALWGGVTGGLFVGSFDAGRTVGSGIVLSGLGMGTLGGVLMTRYFNVSRGRAALIDVGGTVGIFIGIAIENVVTQANCDASDPSCNQSERERTANYSLGGMAAGLILAGVLTRNMDAPKLSVSPVISKTSTGAGPSTSTFGFGGRF
ncbi:MAG TPA: tetratricopeptide repeat protein [Kofleriaceae bacterium]|nr:tetratricopeptide repeat protein [Kofleriaceae bacterium]